MTITANVERTVKAPLADAFAKFIDFRLWHDFMPEEFRPIAGPDRVLKPGDRMRVRLDTGLMRMAVPVDVFMLDEPHEIVWGGGSPLLHARHSLAFHDAGEGHTRIASVEDWTGLLSHVGPIARRVLRQAEVIAEAQLGGFANYIEAR